MCALGKQNNNAYRAISTKYNKRKPYRYPVTSILLFIPNYENYDS